METLEAVFTRHSVRSFSNKVIDQELLKKVMDAGAASPSGGNVQAWGFVLIQSLAWLKALRALAPGIIGQPTAVIAVCIDTARASCLGGVGGEKFAWMDIGLATQNMLLVAHSLGLGACPVGSFHHEAVSIFLGVPQDVEVVLLLTLGYPKTTPPATGRRVSSETQFLERWGSAYAE
jgi:nitroreductase